MAHWAATNDRQALTAIRRDVFVDEQQVPEEDEMDTFDETSLHLLAHSGDSGFIGCARIMPSESPASKGRWKNNAAHGRRRARTRPNSATDGLGAKIHSAYDAVGPG